MLFNLGGMLSRHSRVSMAANGNVMPAPLRGEGMPHLHLLPRHDHHTGDDCQRLHQQRLTTKADVQ
jgi:hypothetical protein